MSLLPPARSLLVMGVICAGLASCSKSGSPGAPTGPPVASPPAASAPVVTTLSVNTGSTSGGTPLSIVGNGFEDGATATFGTTRVSRRGFDPRVAGGVSGSLLVNTPEHAAGLVDVIVTNPDGQSFRLARGFEFQAPESFDINGAWEGGGSDGSHIRMALTVRNNVLVSATCDSDTLITVALASPVTGGEFSAAGGDGFRLSGRIVSPSDVIGTISGPSCGADISWKATRVPR